MRAWLPAACLLVACRAPPPMLPIVQTPAAELPPVADIVRACAFEVSCLHDPPAATMRNCIVYLTVGLEGGQAIFVPKEIGPADFRRYIDCANHGSDCAGVLACASLGHDAAYCAAHPGSVCDGDLLVPCPPATVSPDAALFTVDCAALGMHCAEANGSASCTNGIDCDPNAEGASCDGNRYFDVCDRTTRLRYRLDCARWSIPNATCRDDGQTFNRTIGCLPSGAPCAGDRCEGDVLVTCYVGEERRLDCAQLESACAVVDGKPGCVPIANDCSDSTQDQCAGSGITTCFEGSLQKIDCSTVGGTTCVLAPGFEPICG
jgi:hypothetical protein